MSDHAGIGAILVGDGLYTREDPSAPEGKVDQVEYVEPMAPSDSGFICYLEETPSRELRAEDGALVCLHCLIDNHPEAGPGMEMVKALGYGHRVGFTEETGWVQVDSATGEIVE